MLPLLDAAAAAAGGEEREAPAARHLRAQVLYRQGSYAACVPLYERELRRLRRETR